MKTEYEINASWEDSEGHWHDRLGRVWESREEQLHHRAESCGCGQCRKRYEDYLQAQYEEEHRWDGVAKSAIATLELNWLMMNDPYHFQYWINTETGDVQYAYPEDERGDPWLLIDLEEDEDGETEE